MERCKEELGVIKRFEDEEIVFQPRGTRLTILWSVGLLLRYSLEMSTILLSPVGHVGRKYPKR
jgi:hypothetical protein